MMKIFIVDDSELVRERLIEILSDISEVDITGQTGDPCQAIEDVRKLKPDVVILDIRLPGRSGIDLLPDIKHIKPAPVVIMLTNYPYPQCRRKCMEAGADFFFDKSTEFEKIRGILKKRTRSPEKGDDGQGATKKGKLRH